MISHLFPRLAALQKFSSPSTEITENSNSCESGRSFNQSITLEKEDPGIALKIKQSNATCVSGNSERKIRKNKMIESEVEKLKYNILLTTVN